MSISNIIVLCAIAFYMVIMILIGAVNSKNTKNNEDYFLGGRGLGAWTAAISAEASDMSGWLLMGLPGAFYLTGSGDIWIAIGLLIGTILNWIFVSKKLRRYTIKAENSLTIPSFFDNRFKSKGALKIVSAIIIAIFFSVYTASAFSSGAKLFATLFGNDDNYSQVYLIGLIIAAVVILVYTLLGGFKAVCTTDLIQGMLMLVAILTVPIIAYAIISGNGGFDANLAKHGVTNAASFVNPFTVNDQPIPFSNVISGLAWGLGYFGMPHILVRFMAVKSEKEIKKSGTIAIIWVSLAFVASFFIGILGRAFVTSNLTDATSETVLIRMIQQIFTDNFVLIFIGGIFLCGILAAIMSTADSQLLVTASAISEDMYKGAIKKDASEKNALMIGRVAVIVIAVIAFAIAIDPNSSIMGLVSDAWAGFGAAFGPVVLLALFWKRSNAAGAMAGMISGALTVIVWDYIPMISTADGLSTIGNATGLYSLAVGFPVALVIMVIVSLITKKPNDEIVKEFESVQTYSE
ncbi:MAG: sodium/proline symporter PutP [Ruminococcus sp.]|nr:sodium/proline symporter PutP [Ruminococcus sp.]